MRVYEVVKDHKSGRTKLFSYEEKPDPFSRAAIRRHGEDKRARIASLKAWWVALRYSWRDQSQRTRILGHALFFVALSLFPITCAIVAVLSVVFNFDHVNVDEIVTRILSVCGVVALIGVVLWFLRMKRKLFGR